MKSALSPYSIKPSHFYPLLKAIRVPDQFPLMGSQNNIIYQALRAAPDLYGDLLISWSCNIGTSLHLIISHWHHNSQKSGHNPMLQAFTLTIRGEK
jgi:hypothetical protein